MLIRTLKMKAISAKTRQFATLIMSLKKLKLQNTDVKNTAYRHENGTLLS